MIDNELLFGEVRYFINNAENTCNFLINIV